MSENPTKWSRKRSSNVEDERSSLQGDENIPKKTDWKVKTLEEIRLEKRRKLDNESPEVEREGSRMSSISSTTSSPSLKIESRSSSKRESPLTPSQEIIYQLSPEHSSPLSTSSSESSRKRPQKQKNRRRTEEEEGEILSDISDEERKSRGNSRRTSTEVEMAEKLPAKEEEQDSSEEESSEEDSESSEEEEVEQYVETKVEQDVADSIHDKNEGEGESSEEDESSDSDSEDSEESSEDEEEEKNDQAAENQKEEIRKANKEESDDESEDVSDESESEDSEDSDSSEEEEEQDALAKDIKQKQNRKPLHKDEQDGEKMSRVLDSRKGKVTDRKEKDTPEQQSKSREKYEHHSGDTSKSSRRGRHEHDEYQEQRHGRERLVKDGKEDRSCKSIKSRERYENQTKGERISSEKEKASQPLSKERKQVTESYRSKQDDRDSHKRKRRGEKNSNTKDEGNNSRKGSGSKNSNIPDPRQKEARNLQEETAAKLLTDQERLQFSTEVVDSDHQSSTDDSSDSEIKKLPDVNEPKKHEKEAVKNPKLPDYYPAIKGCRNVSEEFVWLNRIEEGTYGVVYRARDKRTNEIVALKRLKMEKEKEGFPITSLREINTLLKGQHPNIVTVREIVVGNNMDRIYIVMDYVEHDLKTLMEHMNSKFSVGEVKSLLVQLLRAVTHLHDNWILHRDLKTSNLLLSNDGILKVGDFGLAREYGSPLRHYTPIVVTLWYRAPELLLGIKEYSCPIDLWSVGCIFAELLTMKPLFTGKSEIDQINRIFKELGTPSDSIWPGPPKYSELPHVKKMTFTEYPYNNLRNNFGTYLTDKGFDLLNRFLTFDPSRRITADEALKHEYFNESPLPVDPDMFPTWPAKSEMMQRPRRKDYQHSPKAPEGGEMFSKLKDGSDSSSAAGAGGGQGFHLPSSKKGSAAVAGFVLKF